MGEIKKYDGQIYFADGQGRLSREVSEIKVLNVGDFWSEEHLCSERSKCKVANRLAASASHLFGIGNYSVSHRNGIIAVLRKA